MVDRRKARVAVALNVSLLMPMLAVLVAVIAAPVASAAGSCVFQLVTLQGSTSTTKSTRWKTGDS